MKCLKRILICMLLFMVLFAVSTYAKAPEFTKNKLTIVRDRTSAVELLNVKQKISWSVADKGIASVYRTCGNKIYLYGKKTGTTELRAKIQGTKTVLTLPVKVRRPLRIAVAYDNGGNTGSVVARLKQLNAEPHIVRGKCDIDKYDGLVLPGGADINPSRYHESFKGVVGVSNHLDNIQFTLTKQFVNAKKPIFGICRGQQLLNVYFGGTLKQNIGGHRGVWHNITNSKNSVFYELYGKEMRVNSYHHQAINKLGNGLIATSRGKGQIETIQHETLPIIAVQWHPEIMKEGKELFQYFLSTCAKTAGI